MYEMECYDLDGVKIDMFNQWDSNQKIIVKLKDFSQSLNSINPKIHFTNSNMTTSLLMQSSIENENIIVDVPNVLLKYHYPITIYYHFTSTRDPQAQRTIATITIPVRKKNKPQNYVYEDNVSEYSFEDLVQNVMWIKDVLNIATLDEVKTELNI